MGKVDIIKKTLADFKNEAISETETICKLIDVFTKDISEQNFCPKCGHQNWDRERSQKHCLDCNYYW